MFSYINVLMYFTLLSLLYFAQLDIRQIFLASIMYTHVVS